MAERKSSRIVLRDDMIFTAYSSNGYSLPLDAQKAVGGHDAGISPMELLLTALAGCTGMDVISILRKKQQQVTGFEVQVEGIRAEEHPRVFTEIWVKYTITGRDIDPKAVERAIELSRDKYCGAAATLRHTAQIHYDYVIVETEEVP
mgnify:FL=1|jgi:putative redox protein